MLAKEISGKVQLLMVLKARELHYYIREAYIYTQEQFSRIYDGLMRFAFAKARRFFPRDDVRAENEAAEAVTKAIDKWWQESSSIPLDEEQAKRVILNSIQYASRKEELEPINVLELKDVDGFHAYRVIGGTND
jgi:hypothetical protein